MQNVLIVDDSRMFRRALIKIVESVYNIVGEAADGNEGFEKYKNVSPHLTLLDITMPNCDGRECLKKIMDFDSNSCVIMVSGINDQEIVKECLSLGAKGFVNKSSIDISCPESRQKTLDTISSYLGGVHEVAA